jgi:hypothetical protein
LNAKVTVQNNYVNFEPCLPEDILALKE